MRPKAQRSGLAFLAIALLFHAGLLLLPISRKHADAPESVSLEVSLAKHAAQLEKEAQEIPAEPALDELTPAPASRPVRDMRRQPSVALETLPLRVTASELLEQVAKLEWESPESKAIRRPVSSKFYEEFRKPVLPLKANVFDDFVLPTEVEIVDRWLEPGGTHRVVIRTPTGHTLCGRQEPMDVFRPWLQMPMMFHPCAGGGKR